MGNWGEKTLLIGVIPAVISLVFVPILDTSFNTPSSHSSPIQNLQAFQALFTHDWPTVAPPLTGAPLRNKGLNGRPYEGKFMVNKPWS